jgi:hypothetical protein
MPDVETDNDAAGDNLQSGIVFWRPARMIRMAALTEIMNFAYVTII